MKISVFLGFQGGDWLRNDSPGSRAGPPTIRDGQVYEDNIYIADLLEPLGFDALFQVEHHGSPYHMTSNPLAILYYMAGRTERLEMGTCVVVLPWNNPLRVAEELSVLDNMLRGRRIYVGVGRGARRANTATWASTRTRPASVSRRGSRSSGWRCARRTFSYEGTHYQVERGDDPPAAVVGHPGRARSTGPW